MQPVQAQPGAAAQPGDRLARLGQQQSELRAALAGGDRLMGVGADIGGDPDQDGLRAAAGAGGLRHEVFQPVDVVEVVDDDKARTGLHGRPEVALRLGIAVHDHLGRVGARGEGERQFATTGDIDAEPLLGEQPVDGGAREGLGGEGHHRVRSARGQPVGVPAGPVPQSALVDEQRRGAVARGQFGHMASADAQPAVRCRRGAGREEPEQGVGGRRGRRGGGGRDGHGNAPCWARAGAGTRGAPVGPRPRICSAPCWAPFPSPSLAPSPRVRAWN